jgi:hypothetical protein
MNSELTGVGGGHPCDARWRPELFLDDDESWGKRNARERGVSMQKDSANGRANRQLADGEWVAEHTTARGKKWLRRGYFRPWRPFYKARRERGSGRVPQVGDGRRRRARPVNGWHAPGSPVLGHRQVGHSRYFKTGVSPVRLTGPLFITQPDIKWFI